jgi:hypothetical protein
MARLVAEEADSAGEHSRVARGMLGLTEESRSSFKKTHLRTKTDSASYTMDGAAEKADGAAEKADSAHCADAGREET